MEPVTLTAATIISMAFAEKLLEKASDRYSEAALNKIEELRKSLWERFKGNKKATTAMQALESGNKDQLSRLSTYLEDEMEDNAEFAALVEALAQEIKAGEKESVGNNILNVYDNATGHQNNIKGGTNYIGNIHIHGKSEG